MANDFVYRRLRSEVDRLYRLGDTKLLPFIERVANFAWSSHPGRLIDGGLENILLELGSNLSVPSSTHSLISGMAAGGPLSISRTLHVASEIYLTGGHSRVLAKWVERDHSSTPAIVVTRQSSALPPYLVAIAEARGATIAVLDKGAGIIDRARQLRVLSRDFDRVILHHHPDDAVPVLAYAYPGGCPVAMFNHAHFWFSLGGTVADMIVNTMPYFQKLTQRYRSPKAVELLNGPFGLDPLRWDDVDKRTAKMRLGLAPDKPVAMSIGSESYFAPFGGVSFFGTLAKLLVAYPDLQVIVVGVRPESALIPADIRATQRVRFTGPVSDPQPYYRAADICLESFPMPSLGALTEAVAYGQAFPVPAFAEYEGPLRVNQQRIASVTARPTTEEDYVRYVGELLAAGDTVFKRAGVLRRTLVRDDAGFGDQFASLYQRLDRLGHAPCALPETLCETTSETLALASLTDPRKVSAAISRLLPLPNAVATHAGAIFRGYEGPRIAATGMARRLARAVLR